MPDLRYTTPEGEIHIVVPDHLSKEAVVLVERFFQLVLDSVRMTVKVNEEKKND